MSQKKPKNQPTEINWGVLGKQVGSDLSDREEASQLHRKQAGKSYPKTSRLIKRHLTEKDILHKQVKFTDKELEANRNGEILDGQLTKSWLLGRFIYLNRPLTIALMMVLIPIYLYLSNVDSIPLLILAAPLPLAFVIFVWWLRNRRPSKQELGDVLSVTGILNLSDDWEQRKTFLEVQSPENKDEVLAKFELRGTLPNDFEDTSDNIITIYYLQKTKMILSFEAV